MRPNIKAGDVDLSAVVGIVSADGWVATYSMNEQRPVLFWVLLNTGEVVGLVSGDAFPAALHGDVRAADKMQNFSNYLRK